MSYYNTYDKNYKDLTVEDRIEIWKDYFNIFCVEEVISDCPLRSLCEDELTRDINVYVLHYISSVDYSNILNRHYNLSKFVNEVLCRGSVFNSNKLNIVHLFRDTIKSKMVLDNYVQNESKIIVYRKYCCC